MFKKDTKKQGFTGFDAFMVLALSFTAIGISTSIAMESLRDDRIDQARFGAEAMAHQIASGGLAIVDPEAEVETNTSRGPASVVEPEVGLGLYEGTLGKDPWEQPYHYKLIRSADGRATRILVWSNGPDQKPDTRFSEDDIAQKAVASMVAFSGDDVGYVYDR